MTKRFTCGLVALAATFTIGSRVSAESAKPSTVDACSENRVTARSSHSLAFDATRKQVMMFGGIADDAANRFPTGLWSWDGARWSCDPAPGPSGRIDAALAFDEARSRLVLFGGRRITANRTSQYLVDTWEFDGQGWALRDSAGPGPRIHGAIAYDPARKRVVINGGAGENDGRRDTWEWDGTRWTAIPAPTPAENFGNAMIGSAASLVLVGAAEDAAPDCARLMRAKLYALRNNAWSDLSMPGPCFSPQAPVAATADGLLLFAGWDGPSTPSATWLWNGTSWRRAGSAPTRRRGTSMAYDSARKRVVMFGGDGDSGLLGDTWEWDGERWREVLVR